MSNVINNFEVKNMSTETIENKNLIEVKEVNKEEELVKTINDFCDKLNIFCFKNKIEKHQENSNTRIISDVTADIIKKLHSMQNITLHKRIEAIKDYLKELKVLLRDEILKNQNNIELKDFILKLGLILNSVFGEEKTEEETKVLSLVVVEQVKEEPKQQLLLWEDFFETQERAFSASYSSQYDEKIKIKFKVTESPDYDEPFIEIKGKIFIDDMTLIYSKLRDFEKVASKK
jgi:hypothetical protein